MISFTIAVFLPPLKSGISKGAVAGIVLGAISCAITLILAFALVFLKRLPLPRYEHKVSKDQSSEAFIFTTFAVNFITFEVLL